MLTHDAFRTRNLSSENLASFRDSGRRSAGLIDLSFGKARLALPKGDCLEIGCGVGRVTRHLADRFDRVVAVDISPGNLEICRRYLAEEGVANVATRLIAAIDDFAALPETDFLYSMIVLQHNSPPLQHRMLETLLAKIRPGGSCLFQTVADLPGYVFDAAAYLASPPPEMEVHSLPMAAILALMQRSGFVVDGVRMDSWLDAYGSYTFLAHRPD